MNKSLRILMTSLGVIASIPAIGWLLCELVVYYEYFSTGVSSRAELGEDLGLGILLFLVVPPGTYIGTVLVGQAIWSWTGRFSPQKATGQNQ